MKHIVILSIIILTVTSACGAALGTTGAVEGVDLAGMDRWDIVVADDALASEKYAAEEFQEFFSRATGVKLPIVRKISRLDRHVFIGPSEAMRSSKVGFRIDEFDEEDLRIVIRDENIVIAGGRPRGTLYGVYAFLEDYLGVRFLTHDHAHVPPAGEWRVVGPVDSFYRPPIAYRNTSYAENKAHPEFAVRLRNNVASDDQKHGGQTAILNINHSFYRQVPGSWGNQPCLSDPKILDMVIKAVKAELKERPDARNVQVAQNDGDDNYCRCDKCAAIDEREESHMGSLLTFVNAVADECAKTHPNVIFGTLAYNYSRKPPKHIRPRANVQIQLCSPFINVLRPIDDPNDKLNSQFYRELNRWSEISRHMGFWAYDASFPTFSLPVPNIRALEPNIRIFAAHKALGVFMQGANALGADFADLRIYMISHLLWNPNLSGRQLMDEFLGLHYGAAAPPIRRYIDFLHDNAEAKGMSRSCMGTGEDYKIEERVVHAGLDAFDEAMKLADNDVVRERVEKASTAAYCAAFAEASFWTWEHRNKTVPAANAGTGWGRIDEKMPPRLAAALPYARRYFRLAEKHGPTRWAERVTIEQASAFFKAGFGLEEDDPW
jgi:hypothetical protein